MPWYHGDAAAIGFKFQPQVFESLGNVTDEVNKLIQQLATRIVDRTTVLYSHLIHNWFIRISTTLQKANANIIKIQNDITGNVKRSWIKMNAFSCKRSIIWSYPTGKNKHLHFGLSLLDNS